MEIWKPAFGVESHYEVSSLGNLRRHKGGQGSRVGRNFNITIGTHGYHMVRLCMHGKSFGASVHRLVAQTFIRPMVKGECVNHLDGTRLNNKVENLEITSYSGNAKHAVKVLGWRPKKFRGEENGSSLLTEEQARYIKYMKAGYRSIQSVAAEWGVKPATLYAVRSGRNWKHI